MLDTIKLRLFGINDTYTENIDIISAKNEGRTQFVLPAHYDLYKAMLKHKHKNFSMHRMYNKETHSLEPISEDEFLILENTPKINEHWQTRNVMRFEDAKTVKERTFAIKGNYNISSSDSNVNFSINENGGFIDFEFSIPKYLYGHSLAQFIPQSQSNLYFKYQDKLKTWNYNKKNLHKRMMLFIDKFFNDLIVFFNLDECIDLNYVEIRRVDLCYNQFFESKEDSLLFLEYQKKINMKRVRKTSNIYKDYKTSINYHSSSGSYFKIYHKGSEYSGSEGDLKKHMDINKEYFDKRSKMLFEKYLDAYQYELYKDHKKLLFTLFESKAKDKPFVIDEDLKHKLKNIIKLMYRKMPIKVYFLKQEMDKVLRYEISLTPSFFKYAYKRKPTEKDVKNNIHKVFRRNDTIHQRFYDKYQETKNNLDNRSYSNRISKSDMKNYKMFNKWLNCSVSLLLSNSNGFKRHEYLSSMDYNSLTDTYNITSFKYKKSLISTKNIGLFTSSFLCDCVDHFRDFINYYQVKKVDSSDDILSRMKEYNIQAKINLDRYNAMNIHTIMGTTGMLIRNGKKVKKPSDLLTQTEKRKMNLKKVNVNMLMTLISNMKPPFNLSLHEIKDKFEIADATFYRYKKDLELFHIYESTVETEKTFNVKTDFSEYYFKTGGFLYSEKFFIDPLMNKYN